MKLGALILILAVTACTSESPQGRASSSSLTSPSASSEKTALTKAPAASSPSPSNASLAAAPGLVVNTKSVAGVSIGTPAIEAEQRLRARLGKPTSTRPLPGCYGESGRFLTWDTLTVNLSDSGRGPVLLTGWNVERGVSRYRWRLPYDVSAGDTIRKVLVNVPGAEGSVPNEGANTSWFIVHTDQARYLTWTSTTGDKNGRVSEVDYHGEGCD